MSIIDRIIAWIRGTSKKEEPNTGLEGQLPTNENNNRTENETSNQPIMLNTITLSSDMETLYLIDNKRSIEFPLNTKEGILIGTINGQISVVSAINPPAEEDDNPIENAPSDSNTPKPAALAAPAKKGVINPKMVIISAKKDQWTNFYNGNNRVMGLIGIGDIDISIAEPERLTPVAFIFDLKEKVVSVRKKEDRVIFTTMNKK